jgi:hypothetical protein
MIQLEVWQGALLAVALVTAAVLITIWWRQQSYRWALVLLICLALAPTLSWWTGKAFVVSDYRAGCDGLCSGFGGAPLAIFTGKSAGEQFLPGMYALNSLVFLVILLGWTAIIRALLHRPDSEVRGFARLASRAWFQAAGVLILVSVPVALAPLYLPPPEADVRGDPQRIAINARREVYMYDQIASWPVLRVGLDDVRPRPDEQPGMRVCLRTYTLFYLPTGFMFMDMAPEGVHSTQGGIISRTGSCWEPPGSG